MLNIDPTTGKVLHPRVIGAISPNIHRGTMQHVNGIIVHQTDSYTAQSSLSSYQNSGANGAHFLIDKEGVIYQTASLYQTTWHVGKLKARCVLESRCTPVELKALETFSPTAENTREMQKSSPARFPANADSIGIELVGKAISNPATPNAEAVYETVTAKQNDSLQWLVGELRSTLGVPQAEVFRHPTVSRKNSTEAASAQW
ncbi:MAG: peptidoglycan recognition family protein [Pseudomonas sp.]|uniref:peptidoglycan recognition protein family protein n=1 Tax=Pseudomonas sp. TaxID=306 RepID=UPI00339A53CC